MMHNFPRQPHRSDLPVRPQMTIADEPPQGQQPSIQPLLPIFVYGTLMAAPLLAWVLTGSSENAASILSRRKRAHICGFSRHPVRGSDYPALVRTENSVVDGFLVFPKNQAEWNKLDNFEGETYDRTLVNAVGEDGMGLEAYVYLWAGPQDALHVGCWDFVHFERERLDDWLALFDGMEMIG
jgi:gamma-glutamylcyclotransferase (GGCT)/AIG2-like uncharacterized protein YtfP